MNSICHILSAIPKTFAGEPLPYLLRNDTWVIMTISLCFFITTYVLASGTFSLREQGKNFFLNRERASIFNQQLPSHLRNRLLLILQACLLSAIICFDHSLAYNPDITSHIHPLLLLFAYSIFMVVFVLFKWIIYNFVNWIFFDNITCRQWNDSYLFVICISGLLYLPLSLCTVFLHLPTDDTIVCAIFITILCEILLLYKGSYIFSPTLHGYFYLFMYFCTLEIIPLFFLGKGILFINRFTET